MRFFNLQKYIHQLDKPLWGLSFYFIAGSILTINTTGTSFVDDSLEWIVLFKKYGWGGFWHSYTMTSIYWAHDFFSNMMYLVFRNNNFAWFYIILFFHTSAAYYLYLFLRCILDENQRNQSQIIALISSLIFLVGAYHTENLFWIATYHYAITIFYLFVSLHNLAKSKGRFSFKKSWWIVVLFPLMLTMHEMSFFFPFAFIAMMIYFRYSEIKEKSFLIEVIRFGIPFGFFSILILVITKLIKGSFIPHYGVSHVQDHSLYGFLYTLVNYIVKHALFIHNFSFQIREKFYDVDSKTMYLLFGLCLVSILFLLIRNKSQLGKFKDYFLVIFLWLLFFLPVSNMYFFWHFPIQNDRLGYFPSAFLYSLVVLIFITLFKRLGMGFAILFLILNLMVLRINISKLEKSIHFTEDICIPSYQKYIDRNPIILCMPYNYNGFYSFRKIFRFESAMYYTYNKDVKFTYVSSMPMTQPSDSVVVQRINDSSFKMQLQAPGGWFMKESLGGSDFENDEVRVKFADDNQSAEVVLKQYDPNQPILYCTGSRGFVEIKNDL